MTTRTAGKAALVAAALSACAPTVMPQGPVAGPPTLDGGPPRLALVAADGARLPMRAWLPDGEPRAVVLALHGFNDYSNFFDEPGRFLARHGVAAYAYDQRGFGEAPFPGLWPGAPTLVDDLRAAAALLRTRHPGRPLFLLGESMGGAVILVAMTGPEPPAAEGVVLAAPAVWRQGIVGALHRGVLWLAAHTVPWLKVTGRDLGIRPSDNLEMLKALSRDPLVIKETRVDAIHGLMGLMDGAAAAAGAFRPPRVLLLYGEKDEIILKDPTRLMVTAMPAAPREGRRLAVYGNGWHMLLRDLQAEAVWRDIVAWIDDPAAPLPSGADARADGLLAGG
jgi:alpha-beta hydrolase superfamily lysophospholipase